MSLQVEIVAPSPIFKPYIEYYKNVITDAEGTFKAVPNTSEELYFNDKKIRLRSGTRYALDEPQVHIAGLHHYEQNAFATVDNSVSGGFVIVFKPNGIQNLFRLSNSEVVGYAVDGENLFRQFTAFLWSELQNASSIHKKKVIIESYLLRYIDPGNTLPILINPILVFIKREKGMVSAGKISKYFDISVRSLERKFKDSVGISPKEFLQITRLNHALQLLQSQKYFSLTRISYLSGYYDQSHFIKDVEKICGFSPGVLQKEKERIEQYDNRSFLKIS